MCVFFLTVGHGPAERHHQMDSICFLMVTLRARDIKSDTFDEGMQFSESTWKSHMDIRTTCINEGSAFFCREMEVVRRSQFDGGTLAVLRVCRYVFFRLLINFVCIRTYDANRHSNYRVR